MYNYPIIAILVFIFILIPIIGIAFFRGWKATLFISVANLVFIGIEIGVGLLIYDSLWGLLGDFLVGDLNSGINSNSFKEVARPAIMMLLIGVCIIPNYGIVIALYFPLKKILTRHLKPEINNINSNQKGISRSTNLNSRLTAVGIASTSGIFLAATASSAAATLFTTIDNRGNFNKFTSSFSKIYTFGQGGGSNSFFTAKNFAKHDLTVKYQKLLGNTVYLLDPPSNDMFRELNSGSFNAKLKEISKDPDTFKAIMRIVIESDALKGNSKIFLKNKEYQKIDIHGNEIGRKTSAYSGMDAHLDSFKNIPKLNLGINNDSIEGILNMIKNKYIVDFDYTAFNKEWLDNKDIYAGISNRINFLRKYEGDLLSKLKVQEGLLANYYSSINSSENKIVHLGKGPDIRLNSFRTISKITKREFDKNIFSHGTIHESKLRVSSLETSKRQAKIIYDIERNKDPKSKDSEIARNRYLELEGSLIREEETLTRLESEKLHEINNIGNLLASRRRALIDMQETSNKLNALRGKNNRPIGDAEEYLIGTDIKGEIYDQNLIKQSPEYYSWSYNTIPGALDYLVNVKSKLNNLEDIRNREEVEYDRLTNKYLETIKNIFKS